ncbi:MAG TPA: IS200/IS605 family transposase [Verrucomicrobiae bacterium]
MANTFTSLHYHMIFSTKHREPWIRKEIEERLWAYLGGIARQIDLKPLLIGGVDDHVHMLLGAPPTIALSEAVKRIKGGSSGWIKENLPGCLGFGWQDGYGAFTVSKSQLGEVDQYIRNQREHHRFKTFQEEYRAFLDKHEIHYDERYLWD